MANGVTRLQKAKVTESKARGKALADELDRTMNALDGNESIERGGEKGQKKYAKRRKN